MDVNLYPYSVGAHTVLNYTLSLACDLVTCYSLGRSMGVVCGLVFYYSF